MSIKDSIINKFLHNTKPDKEIIDSLQDVKAQREYLLYTFILAIFERITYAMVTTAIFSVLLENL